MTVREVEELSQTIQTNDNDGKLHKGLEEVHEELELLLVARDVVIGLDEHDDFGIGRESSEGVGRATNHRFKNRDCELLPIRSVDGVHGRTGVLLSSGDATDQDCDSTSSLRFPDDGFVRCNVVDENGDFTENTSFAIADDRAIV